MVTGILPFIALRQTRAVGAALLVLGVIVTGSLTVPVVAEEIAAGLTPPNELTESIKHAHADAVVLLLGDSPWSRVAETVRMFRRSHPRWVIVSGPPDWAERLRALGVPRDRILVESRSQNTYEQAEMLEPILETHGIRRMFLVASRLHMRRAEGTFRSRGYHVVPVSAPVDYQETVTGWRRFLPRETALALSRDAIYEYAAWSYYWSQGWL